MTFENSFVYQEHKHHFTIVSWSPKQLKFEVLPEFGFPLNYEGSLPDEIVVDWTKIPSSKSFDFDELSNLKLRQILENSIIFSRNRWFVQMQSNQPIILLEGNYLAKYWWQFINEQGSILLSEDKTLLVEFTHETHSKVYSNFEISPKKIVS